MGTPELTLIYGLINMCEIFLPLWCIHSARNLAELSKYIEKKLLLQYVDPKFQETFDKWASW